MKTFKLVSLAIFVLGGAFLAVNFIQKRNEGVKLNATEMPVPYEIEDFKLQRTDGQAFTRENFLGRYTLLYFGFTRCPDACPTTLAQWKTEIPKLSAEAQKNVDFVLISVDPAHDKPDVLQKYVTGFEPSIKAATGDEKELIKLANSMKTTFHKEEESAGDPDLYMMAHSPRYYLINPKAQLQATYVPPIDPGVLADDLNRLVDANFGKNIF